MEIIETLQKFWITCLYKLMTNKYANYFMKLLFQKSIKKEEIIMNILEKDMVKISLNMIGTHCFQSLLDQMKSQEQVSLCVKQFQIEED